MLQSVKNKQTVSILSKLKMPDDTRGNGPSIQPVDIFSGVESRPDDEEEDATSPAKPKTILRKKKPDDDEQDASSGRNLILGGPK